MMRYSLLAVLALVAGCSSEGAVGTGSDGTAAPGEGTADIGQAHQKSQFADGTVINLVDPLTATLTVTADINPVDVNIFYVSDKTTNAGHQSGGTVNLIDTISLAANQTKQHTVNLFDPAFAGGYGAILLDSTGNTTNDVFQTYVEYGGALFSTGGSVFQGGSYRIPYRSGTIRAVMAFTSQSDFPFDMTIMNVANGQSKTVNLSPLTTYKFDTLANGWFLSGTSSIQITTVNSGTVALSGYIDRLLQRIRITPVKAAPYFSL